MNAGVSATMTPGRVSTPPKHGLKQPSQGCRPRLKWPRQCAMLWDDGQRSAGIWMTALSRSTTMPLNVPSAHRTGPQELAVRRSDAGGERAAAIYSLIETCKLNAIDPKPISALSSPRIADHPINRVAGLLPGTGKQPVRSLNPLRSPNAYVSVQDKGSVDVGHPFLSTDGSLCSRAKSLPESRA